jgi:hypothetical protein
MFRFFKREKYKNEPSQDIRFYHRFYHPILDFINGNGIRRNLLHYYPVLNYYFLFLLLILMIAISRSRRSPSDG